jgi:hypothetical protein
LEITRVSEFQSESVILKVNNNNKVSKKDNNFYYELNKEIDEFEETFKMNISNINFNLNENKCIFNYE